MDEIIIVKIPRFDHKSNEVVGFCANHILNGNPYRLRNYYALKELKDSLDGGEIHKASEVLVIALNDISKQDINPMLVIALPLCSHKIPDMLSRILKYIVEKFPKENPNAFLANLATDGDSSRRNTLNSLRQLSTLEELKRYVIIHYTLFLELQLLNTHFKIYNSLPLFDQYLLFGRRY